MLKATLMRNQVKAIFSCNRLLKLKYSSEGYNYDVLGQASKDNFHQSQEDYPATKQLPLPLNMEDLNSSERLKFSPQRNRDINGSYISSSSTSSSFMDLPADKRMPTDARIECYDCSGTVNLNSAMQSNVPFPFVSRIKPVHLNMPGGQWRQNEKYVSEDLNNVHHSNTRQLCSRHGTSLPLDRRTGNKNFYICFPSRDLNFSSSLQFSFSSLTSSQFRTFSTVKKKTETDQEIVDGKKGYWFNTTQKLKNLVKEYGPVAFVLHITISATALLIIYTIVASGVDTSSLTKTFGGSEGAATAEATAHFVIAFAIHKMLAPVRISLTLIATPFVAKKLRKLGILKAKPK